MTLPSTGAVILLDRNDVMPIGRSKIAPIAAAVLLTSVATRVPAAAAEMQTAGVLRDFPESSREIGIIDRHGRVMDFDRAADRVAVVASFTMDCSMTCISRLPDLAAVADAHPAGRRSRVSIIASTVDPTRDTPVAFASFGDGLKLDRQAVTLASGDPGRVPTLR